MATVYRITTIGRLAHRAMREWNAPLDYLNSRPRPWVFTDA